MYQPRRTHPAYGTSKSSIRIRADSNSSNAFKMPRRQHVTVWMIIGVAAFVVITFMLTFSRGSDDGRHTDYAPTLQEPILLDDGILKGIATAPKLENATLRAELGNAAWKVLHTTMAKFPDKPTADDSQALKSFLYLFARLYPCGECARHFQQILAKFPPQVATRSTAAAWACHVHNEVNKSLKKPIFDCGKIGDFYDCGCADDGPVKGKDRFKQLELEKEGLTRGG